MDLKTCGLAPVTMSFPRRPPSVTWEPLLLPDLPGAAVWVWFHPPQAPHSVIFQVPDTTRAAAGPRLTVRRLMTAAGIDPTVTQSWLALGATFDSGRGANPQLDQALPRIAAGVDPTLAIFLASLVPPMPVVMAVPPQVAAPRATAPLSRGSEALYAAIEADWDAIRIIEAQLSGQRKQLNGLFGRLQGLNRDLNIDEKRAADSSDLREWQEVRRWLRESAAVVSRVLRAYDIGVTSAAGNRNRFDDLFDQYIAPRRPLDGLAEIQQQFESHRKTVQSLQNDMQAAITNASRDGEQRAAGTLSRIGAKVRNNRTKR